jgi:hypothetical protein
MRNSDVEQLFEMVTVGDSVELTADRTDELARIFGEAPVVVAHGASTVRGASEN